MVRRLRPRLGFSGETPSRWSATKRKGRTAPAGHYRSPRFVRRRSVTRARRSIRDALIEWVSATRYGLRIGVPTWDVAETWGDYHFARGLQRPSNAQVIRRRIHFGPSGPPTAARDDVAVHLFGRQAAPTHRGQITILWPDQPPGAGHALVLELRPRVRGVGSVRRAMAERRPSLSRRSTRRPTRSASGQSRGPAPRASLRREFAHGPRRIVDDLAGTTHDLADLRAGWTPGLVDPAVREGRLVPNAELAGYYGAAASCSTTTGTTCSPRASSRTASTTPWPAAPSSSPTMSWDRGRVRRRGRHLSRPA